MPLGAVRVGVVVLLVLAGVAEGAAVAHALTTRHRLCLEHGQAVHIERAQSERAQSERAQSERAQSERAPNVAGDPSVQAADDSSSSPDDTHHHCTLLATSGHPALDTKAETPSPSLLAVGVSAIHLASTPAVGRAVFRLAPKNSPPRSRLA
ncbi:MAG: hypothetical protein IPK13_10860 [Deltaproteobacteria bacterium]|nr:hypothetical protein [Deltaproteobacteria bacterium]